MAVEDFKVYTQDSGWVSLAQTLPQGTSEGQLLHWDGTQWAAASDGTTDGQYLIWDDTAKRWEPGTHETGNLPIQSDDGTVVLDSPSANIFSVSTGGAERVAVSTTDATFNVPVRNPIIGGLVDTDARIGFSSVINFQFMNADSSPGSKINVGYNETSGTGFANVGVGGCYWYLRDSKRFGIGATGINFNANAAANATTYDWKMEPDGTFVANAARGIETAYITGGRHNSNNAPETAPKITLDGTQVTLGLNNGNAYTPADSNSIATKQTVDDKIWVGTTASYNALGANVKPTTLYCLTD